MLYVPLGHREQDGDGTPPGLYEPEGQDTQAEDDVLALLLLNVPEGQDTQAADDVLPV